MEEENSGFEHHDHGQTQNQDNYHQDPNNNNYGGSDQAQYYNHDQQQQQQQPAAGPTQVSSQSAQLSFTYQSNNPPPPPARPNRPVQYHQQQPNPPYVSPVLRPTHENYNNTGTPSKPGGGGGGGYYQTPGSPMKFSSDNYQNGGQGGGYNNNNNNNGGSIPGNYGNQGRSGSGQPAHGFPIQPTPHGMMVQPNVGNPWNSNLFDCMNDPSNALITALCPCITFGQVAEIIDKGNSTCATSGLVYGVLYSVALPCILSAGYRTKLRNMYGLTETPAPDFLTHALCEWCAICQLYRELRDRGLDPSMGWQGNLAKMNLEALQRNNQVQMTPPMHERMMP